VIWSPSVAQELADETNGLWLELESVVLNCKPSPFSQLDAFLRDFEAWTAYYANSSSWSLWWNTGTIESWQKTAVQWRAVLSDSKECVSTSNPLPPGGNDTTIQEDLASLGNVGSVAKGAAALVLVGAAVWFSWPWLAGARARAR
jgi:hypothetical protein